MAHKWLLVTGRFYSDIEHPELIYDLKKDAIAALKEEGYKITRFGYYENNDMQQWAKVRKIDYSPSTP